MNEAERSNNVNNIKRLLTSNDYATQLLGVKLAISILKWQLCDCIQFVIKHHIDDDYQADFTFLGFKVIFMLVIKHVRKTKSLHCFILNSRLEGESITFNIDEKIQEFHIHPLIRHMRKMLTKELKKLNLHKQS